MSEYEINSIQKLEKTIIDGKWSNDGLIQLIELCGGFLNLMTISEYAQKNKLSYNGVKNNRNIIVLFNNKYVVDNI
jgi:hypothetical protein